MTNEQKREMRRLYRRAQRAIKAIRDFIPFGSTEKLIEFSAGGPVFAPPPYPYLPAFLCETRTYCGARTRAGTQCKRRDLGPSGRCKFHGGMSTGPKTEAGKKQARINGRMGGRPRKAG